MMGCSCWAFQTSGENHSFNPAIAGSYPVGDKNYISSKNNAASGGKVSREKERCMKRKLGSLRDFKARALKISVSAYGRISNHGEAQLKPGELGQAHGGKRGVQ